MGFGFSLLAERFTKLPILFNFSILISFQNYVTISQGYRIILLLII